MTRLVTEEVSEMRTESKPRATAGDCKVVAPRTSVAHIVT